MRTILFFVIIFWNSICLAAYDDLFLNKTLRIDYIHSGNAKEEYFALDELIQEPTWDRNRDVLINPFDYGKYKFQAYDSVTGELIYQTSYSTLFEEWQSTEEAGLRSRAFQETVIMPFPKTIIRVEFYTRSRNNEWAKRWSFYIRPSDIMISKGIVRQCKTRQLFLAGMRLINSIFVFLCIRLYQEQMENQNDASGL